MERTGRRTAWLALAVVLLGGLAYANSFHGEFVFDDVRQIVDNPGLRDLGRYLASTEGYRSMPNRFVPYLTFALNLRAGGLAVQGFHAVNLLVHLAAALALFGIVLLAFRTPRVRDSALAGNARAVAFAASALFVTHPLQTQAVTYVVQRITSIATLFYLLTLLLYLASRLSSGPGWRRAVPYAGSVATALLAMRSKEIAFTLPLAILLLEVALFGRPTARRWLGMAPYALVALLIPITLVQFGQPVGQVLADAGEATRVQSTVSRLDYLRTQVAVLATYLRLLAWPSGQNVDHDFPVRHSVGDPDVLAGLLANGALVALAAWAWLRSSPRARKPGDPAWRLVSVGFAFFFLAHAVESSVIPIVDVIFEHRVYLPSAGVFLAVAAAGGLAAHRFTPTRWAAALVTAATLLALVLAVVTLARNRVWWSDLALWTDATAKSPGKARPWFDLGTALAERGRHVEAVEPMRRAVQLDPAWAQARTQLGGLLVLSGDPAAAEAEFREALRLVPGEPTATFNLAEALWRTGRRSEAIEIYGRYLESTAAEGDTPLRRVATRRLSSGAPPPRP